jgi:hypothetical protein
METVERLLQIRKIAFKNTIGWRKFGTRDVDFQGCVRKVLLNRKGEGPLQEMQHGKKHM